MNLLLGNGHPDADLYPLGMLHDEAALVIERMNAIVVAQSIGFRTAYISAKVKDGDQVMGDYVKRLTGE